VPVCESAYSKKASSSTIDNARKGLFVFIQRKNKPTNVMIITPNCAQTRHTYTQKFVMSCTLQKVGKASSDAMPLDRTNEHTAGYAAACMAVGKEMGVPCVDLYNGLQKEQVGSSVRLELLRGL